MSVTNPDKSGMSWRVHAGDPNGPDVAPLATVRLTGLAFQQIKNKLFEADIALPDFRAALTFANGSWDSGQPMNR